MSGNSQDASFVSEYRGASGCLLFLLRHRTKQSNMVPRSEFGNVRSSRSMFVSHRLHREEALDPFCPEFALQCPILFPPTFMLPCYLASFLCWDFFLCNQSATGKRPPSSQQTTESLSLSWLLSTAKCRVFSVCIAELFIILIMLYFKHQKYRVYKCLFHQCFLYFHRGIFKTTCRRGGGSVGSFFTFV